MPVLALALGPIASIARYARASLVTTLNQDYIRTAYAKGGHDRAVIVGHALRNSLIPLVTILGPTLSGLMVGSVLIESIFRIPGLGSYFTFAASTRDYPLLMTSTMFYAAVIMLMNLLVDISYGFLDPRIRYE
jgi:peptide/nickel transport system permease protein